MCNCKNTDGFKLKLAEAKALTVETGQTHVVYALEIPGNGKHVFMRKESELNNSLGICCYFLPDGIEVVYTPRHKAKTTHKKVKKVAEIEFKEAIEVPAEAPQETK
jgi:UDP-N-acetyl-D-mannosaminuronic acid transferase (WecB/TagA/CpsF family)